MMVTFLIEDAQNTVPIDIGGYIARVQISENI